MSKDYLRTKNNYDLMEVRSSLQKTIRRGNLEDSLYWAIELYESNFEAYLIYSLSVIAAEDIGHFNPSTYAAINSCLGLWHSLLTERKKKKQRTELRPALGSIIIMMVTSKKTRMADDVWMWGELQRKNGLWLDIPDVALDEHCRRGKDLGRSSRFWIKQASKIYPKVSPAELGVETDFSFEVNNFYMKNSQLENESDFSEWNHDDPDAEIMEYPYEEK